MFRPTRLKDLVACVHQHQAGHKHHFRNKNDVGIEPWKAIQLRIHETANTANITSYPKNDHTYKNAEGEDLKKRDKEIVKSPKEAERTMSVDRAVDEHF